MPDTSMVVKVLVASPGDLQVERERIHKVFSSWNSANDGINLIAIMWETGSTPELGDHPQNTLDELFHPQ